MFTRKSHPSRRKERCPCCVVDLLITFNLIRVRKPKAFGVPLDVDDDAMILVANHNCVCMPVTFCYPLTQQHRFRLKSIQSIVKKIGIRH